MAKQRLDWNPFFPPLILLLMQQHKDNENIL